MAKLEIDVEETQDVLEAIVHWTKSTGVRNWAQGLLDQMTERGMIMPKPEEGWRVIPNFQKYEMNALGELRHRIVKKIIKLETEADRKASSYSLRPDAEGKKATRATQFDLMMQTWPEVVNGPEWKIISEFPKYQIRKDGVIRRKDTGVEVGVTMEGETKIVRLRKSGTISGGSSYIRMNVDALVHGHFGDEEEEYEGEWRQLPEFPLYEMNYVGDVRSIHMKKHLKKIGKGTTNVWYSLRKDGQSFSRSKMTLWLSVWEAGKEGAA